MDRKYGLNFDADQIKLKHSSLKLFSPDSSLFRVCCPVCDDGILLVARNQKTFKLSRNDRCIVCAQSVYYTDEDIAGEKFDERI